MRSIAEVSPLTDFDIATDRTETPTGTQSSKKAPAERQRRARTFRRILADARRGAREYIERFEAGRGAE